MWRYLRYQQRVAGDRRRPGAKSKQKLALISSARVGLFYFSSFLPPSEYHSRIMTASVRKPRVRQEKLVFESN